jgi:predicted alpha/beta superfamily hydrolase
MLDNYGKYIYFDATLKREVILYFTTNADEDADCPLILMHDGQNLFSDEEAAYGRSWRLLTHIHENPDFPKVRVIGISNNQVANGRLDEYSPFVCSEEFGVNGGFSNNCGGLGDVYLAWVVDTLLPEIRKHIRFTDVYMGGSSMGGYISLAAALGYPNVFKGVFCLSNAWWFAYEPMVERIRNFEGKLPKIYLDTGTHEVKNRKIARYYRDLHDSITEELKAKNPDYLVAKMIKKGVHNEEAWDNRIADILIDLIK